MLYEGVDVGKDETALLASAAIDDLDRIRLRLVGRDVEEHRHLLLVLEATKATADQLHLIGIINR